MDDIDLGRVVANRTTVLADVRTRKAHPKLHPDVVEWLQHHDAIDSSGNSEIVYWQLDFADNDKVIFWFNDEEIAMMFKLAWGSR